MESDSSIVIALIMESDYSAVIAWVSNQKVNPWKFQILFNEIWALSSSINAVFRHKPRLANYIADALAKQGIDKTTPWEGILM